MNIKLLETIKFFFICTSIYGLTDHYKPEMLIEVEKKYYFKKFRFLTYIALVLTLISLLITLFGKIVKKIMGKDSKSNFLTKIFYNLAFSIETGIVLSFWPLFLIDPKLVLGRKLSTKNYKISVYGNLCIHLFPFISLFLQVFIENVTICFKIELFIVSIFSILLSFWLEFTASKNNGRFPYPLLNYVKRIFIFPIVLTFIILSMLVKRLICKKIYNKI